MRGAARLGRFTGAIYGALALVLILVVCACTDSSRAPLSPLPETKPSPGTPRLSQSSASQYGLLRLELFELPFTLDATSRPEVRIGQAPCLLPEVTGAHSLRCLLPGAAQAGSVTVVVRLGQDEASLPFLYTPAFDAHFATLAAIGAGPTAGLRDSALSLAGQLHSWPAFVAQALGAYFPQALVTPAGIPYAPSLENLSLGQGAILKSVSDEAWQSFLAQPPGPATLRLEPEQEARNLAQPGALGELGPLSRGEAAADAHYLAQVLRLPEDDAGTPSARLQSLAPTLVLIGPELADTFSATADETTLEDAAQDALLAPLLDALKALPQTPLLVFTAGPEVNLVPTTPFSGFARYRAIAFANALNRAVLSLNAADPEHPRALLVDTYGFFMDFLSAPPGPTTLAALPLTLLRGDNGENDARLDLGDGRSVSLGLDRLEGLFSLDGASYSDTANALLANVTLDSLDATWGPNARHPIWQSPLPRLDVAAVLAEDAVNPLRIEAARQRLGLMSLIAYADPAGTPPWQTAERCAVLWRPAALPAPDLCPSSLTFAQGAALDLHYGQQALVTALVLDRNGRPLTNTFVAAHSARGVLAADYVKTDSEGNARFRYSAPSDGTDDEVRAFCGQARKRLRIRLSATP